jgi:leucyl aminopeptidase
MGALAGEYAGLFSPSTPLSEELVQAGQRSGEKLWPLPLGPAFAKQIQSSCADIKNCGQLGFGESSAAAEFLKCFVQPHIPWAHLDLAGVAFLKEETPISAPGATGFGVHLIVEWLKSKC